MNPNHAQEDLSILLVDDNPSNLQLLMKTLEPLGHKLLVAKSGELALKIARKANPALVLLDIMMPGMDGFEVCSTLKEAPETAGSTVIFLSALDETADKVRGFQLGAVDFITKPFQSEEVLIRVKTQLMLHRLQRDVETQNRKLTRELHVARELLSEASQRVEGPLLGESDAIKHLKDRLQTLANSRECLLLTGPPGAGHEAVARHIHHMSARAERPFFHINCATLQTTQSDLLLQASLEAPPSQPNKFWLADGGTLYLERITQLPLEQQQSLLEWLQSNAAEMEEGQSPTPDVRLLFYAAKDLHEAAQKGYFLSKLIPYISLHRLSVPSLVERKADIPLLAHFFLRQQAQKIGKLVEQISEESLELLCRYSWPGNIRELQNLLERQVAVAQNSTLEIDVSLLEEGIALGGYRLLKCLGKGGMGEVWEGKHQLLARPAAIKLIRMEEQADAQKKETLLKRFQREARTTSRLQSPNTVTLYDFGVDESGAFYYVMELLEGLDLRELCKTHGAIPAARVIHLLKGVCNSLEEAHGYGLIHRDIKPANVFICRMGTESDFPKVLDFGIVKGSIEGESTEQLTQMSGAQMIGTPGYIAPETLSKADQIDSRFDIYSLGCVAYFALTAREVFVRNNPLQLMFAHATEVPDPPSQHAPHPIPAALDALVLQCLEKMPEGRPQSVRELWEQLDELSRELPWGREEAEGWWASYMPSSNTEEELGRKPTDLLESS